ncbi:Polyphosphate kinase [Pedobacter sp. Bi27]|uniref:polyphosphate kinase 1 n=1 Tax=unclassified Pedobacter TaxID=2628915 RepID=UPI001DE51671|nr:MULTISPECIES: polyphosphate kinase 1 [unclassified Pedobacter]CAH0300421.1 Polyphosphate kinase [Pedobacter sp. Bi27]CAH0301308.1 Polyphosphate kinase [Pedobacter sp. Bi36]CAH0311076.1 Polyphosphate kinase [Pedobacter sp. Bi126]
MEQIVETSFFNRDLSWLKFNERILMEAERSTVPLLERIKFLSIFSSNLDEFYRVRMPVLLALEKLSNKEDNDIQIDDNLLNTANLLISEQQQRYGKVLKSDLIPLLKENKINLIYGQPFPAEIQKNITRYFLSQVMAFLQPVYINADTNFFPSNNELYFLITLKKKEDAEVVILNIPSNQLPRFYKVESGDETFIVFLDDIVRFHLDRIFPEAEVTGCYSFKITRDAEIDLKDEYSGSLSEQLEKQLLKRDSGLATRFLHQPGIPANVFELLKKLFNLKKANRMEGGQYHNLKDFMGFPINSPKLSNQNWPKICNTDLIDGSLTEAIYKNDIIVHTPYQSYDSVLRFFNEAAIDAEVREIYVTLYRVASDSKIVNALISAAKNGKKVTVLVELKARFDEANNIKWAKKMKEVGVDIIYSVTALKVHAKVALVKRQTGDRMRYSGLFSTGNFNESTAAFYTDHILMTANKEMLREVELLFIFLAKRVKPTSADLIKFNHLLVAQFNLQQVFLDLIDREIEHAKQGKPSGITIKMNNLEEKVLINKLYEASQAGVKIELIVRSICRLIPGVTGMSENIKVTRIVDRYLEHGRVFIFHNLGKNDVYLGSADWMNRNIYRRIEVCFPIHNEQIKQEMIDIIEIQKQDNVQAVCIDENMNNIPVKGSGALVESQYDIYQLLKNK